MFNNTKYTKWYSLLILKATSRASNRRDANKLLGYSEKHHIIPKCMNGNNDKENLVYLSAREHFICHLLLTKMVEDTDVVCKLQFALGKFIQGNNAVTRRFTSWEYDIIRKNISLARTGYRHSDATREKISIGHKGQIPWNKDMKMSPISDEHKQTLANLYGGKSFENRYGEIRARDIKLKITTSKLGKPSGMLGKSHSEKTKEDMRNRVVSDESRKKISDARLGMKFSEEHLANIMIANKINGENRRGKHQYTLECPYCKKIGGASGIKRYHFEHCKLRAD